jgi:hypothetical protein
MMVALKYDEISMQEKFIMMEELWEDMTNKAKENGFTPQWHIDVLANREKNIQNSESSFSDLDSAIERLQKLAN